MPKETIKIGELSVELELWEVGPGYSEAEIAEMQKKKEPPVCKEGS